MSTDRPEPNGADGDRDPATGRFLPGNRLGGNPHGGQVARLRAAILERVTEEDVIAILDALLTQARAGDISAIREVFDRTVGKPVQSDVLERLERLEQIIQEREL